VTGGRAPATGHPQKTAADVHADTEAVGRAASLPVANRGQSADECARPAGWSVQARTITTRRWLTLALRRVPPPHSTVEEGAQLVPPRAFPPQSPGPPPRPGRTAMPSRVHPGADGHSRDATFWRDSRLRDPPPGRRTCEGGPPTESIGFLSEHTQQRLPQVRIC